MKKRSIAVLIAVLVMSLLLSSYSVAYAENVGNGASVVFVIDDTASMKTNDPKRLTSTAVEKYVDKLSENTNTGNRIGIVTFDKKVMDKKAIADADGSSNKKKIKSYVKDKKFITQKGNCTNPAAGIEKAVAMLENENTENPKAIILVTDGEYDFDAGKKTEKEQVKEAEKLLKEQLGKAKKDDIKIFTIKIEGAATTANDGKVDFKDIVTKTDGKDYYAKNAEQVDKHITDIQKNLLHLTMGEVNKLSLKANQPEEYKFNIPANVIYGTVMIDNKDNLSVESLKLSDGAEHLNTDTVSVTNETGYTSVHISSPPEGEAVMLLKSYTDQDVEINFYCTLDTTLGLSTDVNSINGNGIFKATAKLNDSKGAIKDSSINVKFSAYDGNNEAFANTAANANGEFYCDVTGLYDGTYDLIATAIDGNGKELAVSNTVQLTVTGNPNPGGNGGGEKDGLPLWAIILIIVGGVLVLAAIIFIILKKMKGGSGGPLPFGRFQYTYANFSTGESENLFIWTLDGRADKKKPYVTAADLMSAHPDLAGVLGGIVFTATGDAKAPMLQVKNTTDTAMVRVGAITVGAQPVDVKRDDIITIDISNPQINITATRM